jgi:L-seryl-tRNA(Ser) seleniumtransferase
VLRWIERTSRGFVREALAGLLDELRAEIRAGDPRWRAGVDAALLETLLAARLEEDLRGALQPVINATGVVLHTNLGRAPLSAAARRAVQEVAGRYCSLELDLGTGERSRRDLRVEPALCGLLGCEAATVVNNNAAAVFLALNSLAAGRQVIVSRGELVEIGGGFRIPEILERSGAVLREVGTTNRTRLADYEAALGPGTAVLLRVHPSNFRIRGFAERPQLAELAALARRTGIPLVEDVGSGCLVDLAPHGVADEPMPRQSLEAGADLVCFSGDKLLGGPQAGIVAGRRGLVEEVRRNPLMRTYRVEKLVYAALQATLAVYRAGRAFEELPVLRAIAAPPAELRARSRRLARALRARGPAGIDVAIRDGGSVIGGGSCPDTLLPTTLVAVASASRGASRIEATLRAGSPAILVRVEQERALIDLRTVLPGEEPSLIEGLLAALGAPGALGALGALGD